MNTTTLTLEEVQSMHHSATTVDEALELAAQIIESPGWWRRRELYSRDCNDRICGMCALGALRYVSAPGLEINRKRLGVKSLWKYNDAKGRTAAEVAALLRSGKGKENG